MAETSTPSVTADAHDCDCDGDPVACLRHMFVDLVQGRRVAAGQMPARRPVFLKLHGVAHGRFEVGRDLPADLRVGVLRGDAYPCWVRFSSDTLPGMADLGTTVGIAIKLFGVDGAKLIDTGSTHDFLLQNHDVFFVDTAREMCAFTRAGVVEGDYDHYLKDHPATAAILRDMQRPVSSLLSTIYWSVVPHAFGARFVKHKLEPLGSGTGPAPPVDDPHYLQTDLRRSLKGGEARFRFLVQLQRDPAAMPLDRATVRWSEADSAPLEVGTLILPAQDIDARGQAAYGENLAFNPWHCLAEHAPQGSISDARRVVYAASAAFRRHVDGIPVAEPGEPRPPEPPPAAKDTRVVRAAIHPAIGIARVGNSQDAFFIGPEVPDPAPPPPGSYRDASGALKRQAARFRIFGFNEAGEVVAELGSANARVVWTAHLANKKAAWYQFQIALDIPEAGAADPSNRRNVAVADRASLVIDGGERSISGPSTSGADHSFVGAFVGKDVYLGELRTDDAGRLLVLGGRGVSASIDGKRAETFANNDGWYDDVADGPVTATVSIDGRDVPVEPAWVVVGPPSYAPARKSVRTLYDLLVDAFVAAGRLPPPGRPSFGRDILPIFSRLAGLGWVNAGFAALFGPGGAMPLGDPSLLARLASADDEHGELRRVVANQFRVFERDAWSPVPWPPIYGDAMNVPTAETPRQHATLTATQLAALREWAAGRFDADWTPASPSPASLDTVPLADRPPALDRAALDHCVADAFHPGCELTWPIRHVSVYAAPFRIRHRQPGEVEPPYGTQLTAQAVMAVDGPLHAQGPGDLTRWMAVPWQTDTASCLDGYYIGYGPKYDPYLPTFWPARVPNEVLAETDYAIAIDPSRSRAERLAAFARRPKWTRNLGGGTYIDQINALASDISRVGLVETRPGVDGDPDLPAVMEVEQLPPGAPPAPHAEAALVLHVDDFADAAAAIERAVHETGVPAERITVGRIDKVRRFPRGLG